MKWNALKKPCCLFLSLLLLLSIPVSASANSMGPPCFVVVAENTPRDFSLGLRLKDGSEYPKDSIAVYKKGWETHFRFEYGGSWAEEDTYFEDAMLVFSFDGETHETPLPLNKISSYQTILMLNIKTGEVTVGHRPLRTLLLAFLRIMFTILIEGLVFFLFQYRTKRSWVVFVCINLATQIGLNLFLITQTDIAADSYNRFWILIYIVVEFFVFLTEMIALPIFLKEHGKGRAVLCALLANTASLFVGGFLLSNLPI